MHECADGCRKLHWIIQMIEGLYELEKVKQTRPKFLVCASINLDVNSICRSYHVVFLDDKIIRYYFYKIEKKARKNAIL